MGLIISLVRKKAAGRIFGREAPIAHTSLPQVSYLCRPSPIACFGPEEEWSAYHQPRRDTSKMGADSQGRWAPDPQDADFLDYAPDECPRGAMREALTNFLELDADTRAAQQRETYDMIQQITGLSSEDLAPHVMARITVTRGQQEAEDWYAEAFLGKEQLAKDYPRLRTGVCVAEFTDAVGGALLGSEEPMEGAHDGGEGGGDSDEGMEFTPEDDEEIAGAHDTSLHVADARDTALGTNEPRASGQTMGPPRLRPRTARTHEEVISRVSSGKADTSSAVPSTVKGGARWHDPDPDAREDRVQAESDQEADDFQEGEGKETASEVPAHYILRWRRKGESDQTCQNLDELFLDHPPHGPAQPPAPSPERQMDVMRARIIFGTTKEFVFRQGVQTPRAPNGAPASEEALHWLAAKARDNPVQRMKGVDGFLPHTREVLRRILAKVYSPTRLQDLQGPARGGAMADLEGRFAFRTKGLAQDFESNVYNGTVILHMGYQGSTATVDLEKRRRASNTTP
jgi:hypothetical protein